MREEEIENMKFSHTSRALLCYNIINLTTFSEKFLGSNGSVVAALYLNLRVNAIGRSPSLSPHCAVRRARCVDSTATETTTNFHL